MERLKRAICLFFLVIGITGCGNPVPLLISLSPDETVSHLPSFTLAVSGTDFTSGSKIVFNGIEKSTTFINSTELTCEINPDDIAVGPATIPVLVRTSSPGGGDSASLYFSVLYNHTFCSPVRLSDSPIGIYSQDISVDNNGSITVVMGEDHYQYYDNGVVYLTRSTDRGLTWEPLINVSPANVDSYHPAVAVDPSGNINVVWQNDSCSGYCYQLLFRRSTDSGSSWSGVKYLTDDYSYWSAYSDISADGSGNIYVAYENGLVGGDDTDIFITRSNDSGNTWTIPLSISGSTLSSSSCSMALDNSGNIIVVWHCPYDDGEIYFSRSTDGGGTWSLAKNISLSTSQNSNRPDVDVDPDGNIYVIWWEGPYNDCDFYFSRSTDNGVTWSTPRNIATDGYVSCRIAVDSASNINVVYRNTLNKLMFIRSIDNGITWTPAIEIDDYIDYIATPKIDLDPSGYVYLTYLIYLSNQCYFSCSGL